MTGAVGCPRAARAGASGALLLAVALVVPPAAGQEPEVLGAPSAWGVDAEVRVMVPAGTVLHERPDARSGALEIVDAEVELPELDRWNDWVRVRYGGLRGWVWLGGEDPGVPPDPAPEELPGARGATDGESGWDLLSRSPSAPSGPAARSDGFEGPSSELVARVQDALGPGAVERDLGPWTLLTDVENGSLIDSFDRLAEEVLEAYRERFGLEPPLPPAVAAAERKEVVVLFDAEESFRRFAGEGGPVSALDPAGQAGFGVAAMARGERTAEAVRALFVHEVVHLLNRRSLGPRTPAWLEEGMADALAISRIAPSGALDPKALGGAVRTVDQGTTVSGERQVSVEISGGLSLLQLVTEAEEAGVLPSLGDLTSEGWQALADPEVRTLRYAQSALFVRFLLDGDRKRWRAGFHRYLQGVATGQPADAGRLLEVLELDGWDPLEEGFERHLRFLRLTH